MRVGIDALPFAAAFHQTGVARYLSSMLGEMIGLAPDVEFLLYSPLALAVPLPDGNWRIREVGSLLSSRPTVWVQCVLPRLLALDEVDVFWGQPTNLPLWLQRPCLRVLTIHDLVPYMLPSSMRFRSLLRTRLLLRLVARASDCVVAVSGATAKQACHHLGVSPGKVRVILEAAASTFRPQSRREARATIARGFGLTRSYILYVSTIEPRKDHLTLLEALSGVPEAPLLVLIGGRGWRCGPILSSIRKCEEAGSVRYLGRVDDEYLPALYGAAEFSVYPSLYEGFGLPVLEAMACGCPVLCSDSSSLPEVGGDAARFFRAGDMADLTRKLREMCSDSAGLEEMSAKGLAHARSFSFRKAAAEMLSVITGGAREQGAGHTADATELRA